MLNEKKYRVYEDVNSIIRVSRWLCIKNDSDIEYV